MKKYFTKEAFKNGFTLLKGAFNGFLDDKALKLSASLAYYTVFSLAPLLLLMISLAGAFFGNDAINNKVFEEINGLVGNQAAKQIQDMIKSVSLSGKTTSAVIIGGITLLLGATSVFSEIQDSINMIWKVKAKPKRGWLKLVQDRLLSSSLIVALGFLLIVSLVINGMVLALSDILKRFLPDITVIFVNILNVAVSFIVISVLFGVIFKVLPDVKIRWKDVRSGALFTAVLFMIGRFAIGLYITTTGTGSTYGAAGSLIVILVWVYYTAAILYFGAEFTQVYAEFKGVKIEPADFAVHVQQTEIERDVAVLPPTNKIEKS
ncbi:YihY/virulence factor BrkB family protein [Mucilaginibacter arboris]|uniref:YihY family inner membrane protein n=1 Tax=Mucilaginibacter arboris TaxID=2682090 RepID=A0A7K1SZE6_9SPHI|nr:YihY/virulence factor BrkB family protein [Mucilaginibacter arboris]MVN22673.1 YihY family inner membrane protein [Mucilaginibacter arboris]